MAKTRLEPHTSHDMSEWRYTIVTLTETSRFGEIRSCKNCGAEHAVTVCGEDMHDELYEPCECVDKHACEFIYEAE